VILATDGAQEKLLRTEFPDLVFIKLTGYNIRYSKKWLMWRLAGQLFKIQHAISNEQKWLQPIIETRQIDWIISDNRYGLWSHKIPSTFITHQLHVKLPARLKWAESYVQSRLYSYISRYDACWVPDLPDSERGLSGELGHPAKKLSIPVWYLGWLSRFFLNNVVDSYQYRCLIILSGPEPQRTLLENILAKQLLQSKQNIIIVRGLPNETNKLRLPPNIKVYNHLPATELSEVYSKSEYIISRSGYSTLMDAFILQKKCIFIPTPGQTEQEYLGRRLTEQKMALVFPQHKFDLENALAAAAKFTFHFPLNSMNNLLEMAIDHFLTTHFNKPVFQK